jgi:hypothetical protein
MARKTDIFVVTTDGRDKGKRLVITEMPAMKAERWAYRALLALAHAGAQLPEGGARAGMAALAVAGFKALQGLDFEEVRPLLDEMMDCVQIMPDPKVPDFLRPLVANEMEGDDIEDITTLWELRERIFRLHTAFFLDAKP